MVLSEGWVPNGLSESLQVICIRVRQCTVKILDQYIKICRMIGSILHFQVAFPDRLWHSALTHILSDDNITHIHPEVMPRGSHQPAPWYYLLSCYKRWNIFYSSYHVVSFHRIMKLSYRIPILVRKAWFVEWIFHKHFTGAAPVSFNEVEKVDRREIYNPKV